MRLRLSSLVFGGAVFLATLILLYQVLSLPPELRTSDDLKDIGSLEDRIRKLEDDISLNKNTIFEIRGLVKQLSINEFPDIFQETAPRVIHNKYDRNNDISSYEVSKQLSNKVKLKVPNVNNNDCIMKHSSSSEVDFKIEEVYEFLPFDNPDGGVWKQGWAIQYDSQQWSPTKKLQVFVVPHSHNDPGWLKTYEKYYEMQTKHIFDNMVVKLSEDSRRKFIWAEISYFSLWWDKQPLHIKQTVKRLIKNRQLEIVTGGWVMPDEANSHYWAMLEQLITGHEWLHINLNNTKPNIGWAIDPFGMSPTMAYILKRSGFESMVIQRVHYSVKKYLAREKALEFKWRQLWDLGSSSDILCHLMPFYSYDVPHTCGPDPKICCQFDFRRLPGMGVTCPWRVHPQAINSHNVESRAQLLLDQYRKKSQLFRTDVVLVPLGDDFRYDRTDEWDNQFNNYQNLFDYMNSREDWNVKAQFGTLSDYFNALKEFQKLHHSSESIFPVISGDYFAYADREDHYWSGYYTSRPFHKRQDRIFMSFLRNAEFLFSSVLGFKPHQWMRDNQDILQSLSADLVSARKNYGLFQHHDGITGTAKDHVVVDYAQKMLSGILNSQSVIQMCTAFLLTDHKGSEDADIYFELYENFTSHLSLPTKQPLAGKVGTQKKIVFSNPEAHQRERIVTVRISVPIVEVYNEGEEKIVIQIDPVLQLEGTLSDSIYELSFLVILKPLSLTTYTLHFAERADIRVITYGHTFLRGINAPKLHSSFVINDVSEDEISIKNNVLTATVSSSGLLKSLEFDGKSFQVDITFIKYKARHTKETSGAYLFLPSGIAEKIFVSSPPLIVVKGFLRSYVCIQLALLQHCIMLLSSPGIDSFGLKIDNLLNIERENNVEVGMRITTSINSGNIFYSDLNAFQIIKRVRYSKLPIQGNFYPMPSQIFIEDDTDRLTLLGAQPLGASSLHSGEIEVLFDRRLMQDDNRGLGQGVTDTLLTHSSFYLLWERRLPVTGNQLGINKESGAFPSLSSIFALQDLLHPLKILVPVKKMPFTPVWALGKGLPCDISLVNLRSLLTSPQPGSPYPPSSSVALTLHRYGFDCSFPSAGFTCSTSNGKIQLQDVVGDTFEERVLQMSLSLMYDGIETAKSAILTLQPMELYAFKLFLAVN